MNECIDDSFGLNRFVNAQDLVYQQVCWELREGRKLTHWMWFIFPQIDGLSSSAMSRRYAISSLEEAVAYLGHEVLGPRLAECVSLVVDVPDRTIKRILGPTDSSKFQSSMTLFAHATVKNEIFVSALQRFFSGRMDPLTIDALSFPPSL